MKSIISAAILSFMAIGVLTGCSNGELNEPEVQVSTSENATDETSQDDNADLNNNLSAKFSNQNVDKSDFTISELLATTDGVILQTKVDPDNTNDLKDVKLQAAFFIDDESRFNKVRYSSSSLEDYLNAFVGMVDSELPRITAAISLDDADTEVSDKNGFFFKVEPARENVFYSIDGSYYRAFSVRGEMGFSSEILDSFDAVGIQSTTNTASEHDVFIGILSRGGTLERDKEIGLYYLDNGVLVEK